MQVNVKYRVVVQGGDVGRTVQYAFANLLCCSMYMYIHVHVHLVDSCTCICYILLGSHLYAYTLCRCKTVYATTAGIVISGSLSWSKDLLPAYFCDVAQ